MITKTYLPHEHPLAETRLIWMWENQPQLLLEYYKDGTLRERVSEKVRQAFRANMDMTNRGVDKMTVDELCLDIVAPAEGMGDLDEDMEQPISEEMFEKIVAEVMGHEIT